MRQMVSDDQDLYRVVVQQYKKKVNPEYVQGGRADYWVLGDEVDEYAYGPYNTIGTAKAQLTRETIDTRNDGALRWGVAGGWIEKAETTWAKVGL